MPDQNPVFELGLSLAGAISAGAYTAGVIDFLIQALSEWEKQREKPGVAGHRVVLKVMAGASAGAIAGALGAIAVARGLQPRKLTPAQLSNCYPDRYPVHQEYECVLPSLYQTWVELPAMVSSADGTGSLLGNGDLDGGAADGVRLLRSLLDASLLDEIKRAAIEQDDPVVPPVPYVAKRLHVYMTLSNMRGIPFQVAFGRSSYGMQTIGDRVHYVISDLGACDLHECDWLVKDSRASLALSVKTLPRRTKTAVTQLPPADPFGPPPVDWYLYGTTALASGAFPVGLASRQLSFTWEQYLHRGYPVDLPERVSIKPYFPASVRECETFTFECVDGGLVNNNPFDYAQYALWGTRYLGPADGTTVNRAIVMVAPFPEPPAFLPQGTPSSGLVAILKALLPALLNQARFRASDLTPAMDAKDFSRFVIAPLRRIPRTEAPADPDDLIPPELYPIACGLLGGFGGFLDQSFRAHDFQLGRRNCQQFLRSFFWVPLDNATVQGRPFDRPRMEDKKPIIPLLGDAAAAVPMPRWPQMSADGFEHVCDRIKARINAVAPLLIAGETAGALRFVAPVVWRFLLRRRVLGFLRTTMLAELVRHRQITGWEAPAAILEAVAAHGSADDVQAVIAALIGPGAPFQTAADIAKVTHLKPDFVAKVLHALSRPGMPPRIRTWTDGKMFTLYDQCPWFDKVKSRLRKIIRFGR